MSRRIDALDGLRGLCLLLMTITHLHFVPDFFLGNFHFKHVSFADSAHAFVFLSGLLVGMVGMRQRARGGDGPASAARRCRRRALELYGCHLALLLVVVALARVLPGAREAWGPWLGSALDGGPAEAAAAAALLLQPGFLDILPQYALYLLAAPALLRLVAAGRADLMLACSLTLWLAAQFGLNPPVAAVAEPLLAAVTGGEAVGIGPRGTFDPLAWQLAFNAGLILGALAERGALDASRLFPTSRGALLPRLALAAAVAFALLQQAWVAGLLPERAAALVSALASKQHLGLLPVLSFAAIAYLTGWALLAAPRSASTGLRAAGSALRAAAAHPILAALGRRSLPVFALHILLVYGLRYAVERLGGVPDPWFSLAALGALAALYLPVLLLPDGTRRLTTVAAATVARAS